MIANGENAAGGVGVTRDIGEQIFAVGVHVITSGNHIWDKREVLEFIDARAAPAPSRELSPPARPAPARYLAPDRNGVRSAWSTSWDASS